MRKNSSGNIFFRQDACVLNAWGEHCPTNLKINEDNYYCPFEKVLLSFELYLLFFVKVIFLFSTFQSQDDSCDSNKVFEETTTTDVEETNQKTKKDSKKTKDGMNKVSSGMEQFIKSTSITMSKTLEQESLEKAKENEEEVSENLEAKETEQKTSVSSLVMPLASSMLNRKMSQILQESMGSCESQDSSNDILEESDAATKQLTEQLEHNQVSGEKVGQEVTRSGEMDTKEEESTENDDKNECQNEVVGLVTEKQKGIAELLTPLTGQMMDPEMAKMVQDSLNQYVIDQTGESEVETKESQEPMEQHDTKEDTNDDSNVVDLAIEKHKGISNLLQPLTASLDPEIGKMVQDSINQFVIEESDSNKTDVEKQPTTEASETESKDELDSNLVDLATKKQTGISSLLTPLIESMNNPEMAKLVQDSLNEYVISESNEAPIDAAASTATIAKGEDDNTAARQAERLAKEAENLTEHEQQEILELCHLIQKSIGK